MPLAKRFICKCARHARTIVIAIFVISYFTGRGSEAATSWDSQSLTTNGNPAGDGTQWWFDPFNWSGTGNNPGDATAHFLPPSSDNTGAAATDTQINSGTGTLPGGQGVVYDPSSNDPNFANAGNYLYPSGGFGPQDIGALYIARNTTNSNTLTIKGNLNVGRNANATAFQIGRSGGSATAQNLGAIIQIAGTVNASNLATSSTPTNLDIASWETSGWGNGTYDFRGGILDVYGGSTNHGIRLSTGAAGGGTGGVGRFIMHNPTTPGYVRTYSMTVATDRTNGDGITRGVGVLEFHFENGGTRPIQVMQNLSLNNGLDNTPQGSFPASTRSSRLSLILDAAPTVDTNGVPQNLALIDVNSQDIIGGQLQGTGDLDGNGTFNDDRIFSSADGSKDYYPRSAWTRPTLSSIPQDDFLVHAVFGGIEYKWEILYTGNIALASPNAGTVGSIDVTDGSGVDVVLKGVSSGPATWLGGDYNANSFGDAADYTTWRKEVRTTDDLANDPYGPLVGDTQYLLWRANFGKTPTSPGASLMGASPVPEPCTAILLVAGMISVALVRRRT